MMDFSECENIGDNKGEFFVRVCFDLITCGRSSCTCNCDILLVFLDSQLAEGGKAQ